MYRSRIFKVLAVDSADVVAVRAVLARRTPAGVVNSL
jgi:hypothetical protein